jgi:hypothetical protein
LVIRNVLLTFYCHEDKSDHILKKKEEEEEEEEEEDCGCNTKLQATSWVFF